MKLDLFGQDISKKVLYSIVERKITGRSIFFYGLPHVGKQYACLLTGMGFFCKQSSLPFGCGNCQICISILRSAHPRVRILSNENLIPVIRRICQEGITKMEQILSPKEFLQNLLHFVWRAIYQSQFFTIDCKEKEMSLWEKVFSIAMTVEANFLDITRYKDMVEQIIILCNTLEKVQNLPEQILRKDVLRFFQNAQFKEREPTIFVIQNVESIHPDSVFMLLKFLEDSLQNNLFFFLSHTSITSMNPLFSPLLSRCLRLAFSPLSKEDQKQIIPYCFFPKIFEDTTFCIEDFFYGTNQSGEKGAWVDFFSKRNQNHSLGFLSEQGQGHLLLSRWFSAAFRSGRASLFSLGVYERIGGMSSVDHKRG